MILHIIHVVTLQQGVLDIVVYQILSIQFVPTGMHYTLVVN